MAPKVPTKKKSEYALVVQPSGGCQKKVKGEIPKKMRKGFKHDLENTPLEHESFFEAQNGGGWKMMFSFRGCTVHFKLITNNPQDSQCQLGDFFDSIAGWKLSHLFQGRKDIKNINLIYGQ